MQGQICEHLAFRCGNRWAIEWHTDLHGQRRDLHRSHKEASVVISPFAVSICVPFPAPRCVNLWAIEWHTDRHRNGVIVTDHHKERSVNIPLFAVEICGLFLAQRFSETNVDIS